MKNELKTICDKLSKGYATDEGFLVLSAGRDESGHWHLELVSDETEDQEQPNESNK